MQHENLRQHLTTQDARSGTGLNVVRWILLISLSLAILALSAIWITGAMTSEQADANSVISSQASTAP